MINSFNKSMKHSTNKRRKIPLILEQMLQRLNDCTIIAKIKIHYLPTIIKISEVLQY